MLLTNAAYAQDEVTAEIDSNEITVTALRAETLLSKTPVAITTIAADDLVAAGISDPTNLPSRVPNLSIDRNPQGGLQLTIRGITSSDNTEKGDPSVAFLVDGINIARNQAQEVSFLDLERIEVLRGPQGTLYGRNTTAGIVNLISARPKDYFGASFNIAYGNFNTFRSEAMVNLPVNDSIAVRAAVNYDRRDNYTRSSASDGFTLDPFKENFSARLSASFEIDDTIDLIVRGDYSDIGGLSQTVLLFDNFFPDPFSPGAIVPTAGLGSKALRTTPIPQISQSFRNNKIWGLMAELNVDIGIGTFTYLGSYREFDRDELATIIVGENASTDVGDYRQNSQELRFAFGQDSPLRGQVGVYYFREQSAIELLVLDPANLVSLPDIIAFGFPQDPAIAESIAGFGQLSYDISDNLSLTGGIRYSHDDKSRTGRTIADFPGGIRGTLAINDAAVTFDEVNWRIGIDYDSAAGLIYAVASTGYKAGGFNDGCLIGTQATCDQPADQLFYKPETLTAYELGFKLELLDDALRLNASAFHYDYKNLQLSQLVFVGGAPATGIRNAARAKVDGMEFEAIITPDDRNRIDLAFNVLDARYDDFMPSPGVDFSGRALDRAPDVTFSAGYAYIYPFDNGADLEFSIRTSFSSSYVISDTGFPAQFEQAGFTRTDLLLAYVAPDRNWHLQAYINNLENEITLSSVSAALGGSVFATDPRTYGLRAGFKF